MFDKAHSAIRFSVVHMQISEVDGNFKIYDGTIQSSKPDFTDAQINFRLMFQASIQKMKCVINT